MDKTQHWENVYQTKSPSEVSWYESDPRQSLELILEAAGEDRGSVVDVGGGQSFLVDHLLKAGFGQVAVLDISSTAIEATRVRLGQQAANVHWIVADVTRCDSIGQFDIWHDRAVLHFLTDPADRRRYFDLLKATLQPGGHFVVGTFAVGGPERCSGLQVRQYDAPTMSQELGHDFVLVKQLDYVHSTPTGKPQAFFFGVYRRI